MGAHVISNSYGGGESGSQAYEANYNHPGVAITASTGDSGYGAQFPATSPHVIAVGGTHLVTSSHARGWTETVWPAPAAAAASSTPSRPGRPTRAAPCAWKPTSPPSPIPPRASPSMARPGRPAGRSIGGTSVAAPLVGGIYGDNGGSVTYGSDPYANTGALYDVTSGSNGTCSGKPAYFCHAEVGYDGPTGLGTPNGITAF